MGIFTFLNRNNKFPQKTCWRNIITNISGSLKRDATSYLKECKQFLRQRFELVKHDEVFVGEDLAYIKAFQLETTVSYITEKKYLHKNDIEEFMESVIDKIARDKKERWIIMHYWKKKLICDPKRQQTELSLDISMHLVGTKDHLGILDVMAYTENLATTTKFLTSNAFGDFKTANQLQAKTST